MNSSFFDVLRIGNTQIPRKSIRVTVKRVKYIVKAKENVPIGTNLDSEYAQMFVNLVNDNLEDLDPTTHMVSTRLTNVRSGNTLFVPPKGVSKINGFEMVEAFDKFKKEFYFNGNLYIEFVFSRYC